jgi:hypothetical protein
VARGGKFDALVRARGERAGRVGDDLDEHDRVVGASLGKRSNAEYRQVSAYIRKDTHRKVKIALLEEERQFSELVGELLEDWLTKRT